MGAEKGGGCGALDAVEGDAAVGHTPTLPTRLPTLRLSPTVVSRPVRMTCWPPTFKPPVAGDTRGVPPPPPRVPPLPEPLLALLVPPTSGPADTRPLRVDDGAAFCSRAARSMVWGWVMEAVEAVVEE